MSHPEEWKKASAKLPTTSDVLSAAHELTNAAFNSLRNFLTYKVKSNPTEAQLKALAALMDNMSRLAFKGMAGRYAWPLPVGCGKTQSACHWVAAMLKANAGKSIVIACGQVSALNEINRTLVRDLHVDQSLVGTLVGYDKAADVTGQLVFDGSQVPVLLVTHARVHMGLDELSRYWSYQGAERDLLIYDESLISSKSVIVGADEVSHAFYILRGECGAGNITVNADFIVSLDKLICDFQQAIKTVKKQITTWRQQNPDTTVPVPNELRYENISLAPLDPQGKFTDDIARLKAYKWTKPLQAFFDLCGTTVRIVCTELGEAILSFDVTVPTDIENMVILDASSPIRLLAKLDKNKIIMAETLPLIQAAGITNLADLFDYSNVSWYVYRAGGGYKAFQRDKRNTRIKDAVALLKTMPKEESVLFYVFKKRKDDDKKDLRLLLEAELNRQGYDLNDGSVCIETFGRETSLNSYSHCSHVVFVGTPWQNMNDLVATALGQHRDINKHLEDSLLKDLDHSEVAYRYHQGAGRGALRRNGKDGRPQKTSVYCFLQDYQREVLLPLLRQVLPGMQTPAKRLSKVYGKTTKGQEVQDAIRLELCQRGKWANVPDTPTKAISRRSFKAIALKGKMVEKNYYTEQLAEILKEFPDVIPVKDRLVYRPAA